ncbi:MAG: metal ABC transporter ATP-binding protein [Rickettsiaceae bacterium]|nr:metal ABC transporter ATP-binding protein [Rickettsiaceae bacterium]
MTKDILVEFKSVSKHFDNRTLLDNINFTLTKGEITTLIGQNGVGKTTIARIILGLEEVAKGQVILRDNLKIGYVPQKLDFFFNMPLTCEGLMDMLAVNKLSNEVLSLTKFINYEKIRKTDIAKISSGQLQRLLLSGVIMDKPDLLILDEPTQFLDVNSQQEFYSILNELKKKLGMTIFMISHDLFTVMKNTDHVICLNGHVCCSGRPTELNKNVDFKNALSEIGVYIHNHDHRHE